jgi:hypothetical protein
VLAWEVRKLLVVSSSSRSHSIFFWMFVVFMDGVSSVLSLISCSIVFFPPFSLSRNLTPSVARRLW